MGSPTVVECDDWLAKALNRAQEYDGVCDATAATSDALQVRAS